MAVEDYIPRRPEQTGNIEALIASAIEDLAIDFGVDPGAITTQRFPSTTGDTYRVFFFMDGKKEPSAQRDYYRDLNGYHLMDPRKK